MVTAELVSSFDRLGEAKVGVCGGVNFEARISRGREDLGTGDCEGEDIDGMCYSESS